MKRFALLAPSLLSIFAPLFFYFNNREVVSISPFVFILSLLLIGIAVFSVLLVLKIFLKNYAKATILTTLLVVVVFYYGYFYQILKSSGLEGFISIRHRFLMPVWVIIFILIALYVLITKRNLESVYKTICIFTITLSVLFASSIALGILNGDYQKKRSVAPLEADIRGTISLNYVNDNLGYFPDIYYIVPDGYANSEVLREFFSYDNEEFLSFLRNKNFTIISNSKSNYSNTMFSLPATLNMEYGDTLINDYMSSPTSERRDLLEKNLVVYLLKNLRYKYISISSDNTSFSGEISDKGFRPSLLFSLLIRPTIFDPFSQGYRSRILNAFSAFDDVVDIQGPKFVIAHILAPHDPYVFGPDGENIGFNHGADRSTNDMKLYLGQLKFVNKKLESAINTILNKSERAPLIIIQSDHGIFLPDSFGMKVAQDVRFKNFSAYLLPGEVSKEINPPDTNINTFRFIFNQYFGAEFNLLENKTFWSGDPIIY